MELGQASSLARWFREQTGWHESILPSYTGAGIGNLAGTVMHAFGCAQPTGDPGLLPSINDSLLDPARVAGARVVVLIVLDGYGCGIANRGKALAASAAERLVAHTRLTSVFPSTTAAALTSIQTGASPGRHGVAGYTLHLPEARRVVNMIQFTAVDGSSLPARVADPTTMLPVPTVYERLAECGVESVVVSHSEYERSPLTILHSGDTAYRGHRTASEFALMLLREANRPGRRFVFGYWAGVDMLGHTYGPSSAEVALEASLVEQALQRGFLQPLAAGAEDVVVIVTADHGLVDTPDESSELLSALTKRAGKLHRPPTGERRALGLSTTDGGHRDRLSSEVGARGVVLESSEAINAGLYGPAPRHVDLLARVGESLLLARNGFSFSLRPTRERGTFSLGAHGSLTPDEMLVPLVVWRFV